MINIILLIIVLTFIVWVINKILHKKVCPICAGVSLTWLSIFFGIFFGKLSIIFYQIPLAILAGGTVVGAMSKLEPFIKVKFILIWKTIFVVSGFLAVYSLITSDWITFLVTVLIDIIVTIVYKTRDMEKENIDSKNVQELKEKMKNCC